MTRIEDRKQYIEKAIKCSPMLPPPGDDELKKVCEWYLELLDHVRGLEGALSELVRSIDSTEDKRKAWFGRHEAMAAARAELAKLKEE